jgi:hypothetical protein
VERRRAKPASVGPAGEVNCVGGLSRSICELVVNDYVLIKGCAGGCNYRLGEIFVYVRRAAAEQQKIEGWTGCHRVIPLLPATRPVQTPTLPPHLDHPHLSYSHNRMHF